MSIVSIVLFCIVFVVVAITTILMFRMDSFYSRILLSSNIDTVGTIVFMVGVCLSAPSAEFVMKTFLVLVLALITNPISSHATARSAFISGYRPKDREDSK